MKLNVNSAVHAQESGLTPSDAKVLAGALTYQDRTVREIMTPMEEVFSLPIDACLDKPTIIGILKRGHTRIPVYDGSPQNMCARRPCPG